MTESREKKLLELFSGIIIRNTIRITIDYITSCQLCAFIDVRGRLYYCRLL